MEINTENSYSTHTKNQTGRRDKTSSFSTSFCLENDLDGKNNFENPHYPRKPAKKSRAGSCQPELAKVNVNRPTTSSMPPRAEVVGWHQNTQKRPVNCSFGPSPSSSAAQECIKSETERRTELIYHGIENAEKLLSEQSKDPRRRKIETNK